MRFQTCLSTEPAGSPLSETPHLLQWNLSTIIKRTMDLLGGLALLALSLPWLLLTALRIKRRSGGPVFQTVEMLGFHCRPFRARVFRSGKGVDLSWGAKRIPLLIPLIKGEMSLVGPPPVLASEEPSALQWGELRQLAIKPGLTGPWLVQRRGKHSSRKAGKANDKPFGYGSLRKDLAILWRTALLILTSSRRMGKEEDYASTG